MSLRSRAHDCRKARGTVRITDDGKCDAALYKCRIADLSRDRYFRTVELPARKCAEDCVRRETDTVGIGATVQQHRAEHADPSLAVGEFLERVATCSVERSFDVAEEPLQEEAPEGD